MEIRNIVFDMGNVLLDCDMLPLIRAAVADERDAELLHRELVRSVEWAMLDRGSISPERALAQVQMRLPAHLREPARTFLYGWYDRAGAYPGMEALIRTLKSNGYALYVLSNIHTLLRGKTGLLPAADCFSGFFLSAEHGVVKPETEMYRQFFSAYALAPETCLFIDDSPYNIESAMRCGMRGVVFHADMPELYRKLADMEVRL